MSGHTRTVCRCGQVVAQCRCPGPHEEVVVASCFRCKVPASGAPVVTPEAGTPNPAKLPDGQHVDHWVLPEAERAKGFQRPVRTAYKHEACGGVTSMGRAIAETYARYPAYYGSTFCATCGGYFPVGAQGQFAWLDGEKVGT